AALGRGARLARQSAGRGDAGWVGRDRARGAAGARRARAFAARGRGPPQRAPGARVAPQAGWREGLPPHRAEGGGAARSRAGPVRPRSLERVVVAHVRDSRRNGRGAGGGATRAWLAGGGGTPPGDLLKRLPL